MTNEEGLGGGDEEERTGMQGFCRVDWLELATYSVWKLSPPNQ